MTIGAIIFYTYLLIGFCIMIYDWYTYQKSIYDQAKKMDMVEDGMVAIYIMGVIILWPVKVATWLFK